MKSTYLFGGSSLLLVTIVGISAVAQPPANSETQREIARLQRAVKEADQGAEEVGKRLPRLQTEVEKLQEKVKKIEPPKSQPPLDDKSEEKSTEPPSQVGGPMASASPKKDVVPEVEFRLPLGRKSSKAQNIGIVCHEANIFILDFKSLNIALNKAKIQAQDRRGPLIAGGTISVDQGDFDLNVTVLKEKPGFVRLAVKRKTGRKGESIANTKLPGSNFQKIVASLDPSTNAIQICVYSDSYPEFQSIRESIWALKFDEVGWLPFKEGASIFVGGGAAIVQ